jgi:citrate synthase
VNEFHPGLEGVIAFETEIAEPDKEGNALRYRGVDIEELVGQYPFEQVWGLLVDSSFEPGMPHAERIELQDPSGSVMADLQAGLATLGPKLGLKQLVDITAEQARDDLARLSAAALSLVAQAARGDGTTVPESEVEKGENAAAQFLIRWRGEADPRHVKAVDTYWVSAAEHGLNASTFTARIAASTGADCAAALSSAVGALSGPLHGGAPTRVLKMLDEVEASGDADAYVHDLLDRGDRIMGFGHRVYRAEDPRARVLRRTAKELGSKRVEVAERLEQAALAALREKSPDRVLETNVEFWAAVVLEVAEIPPAMYPAMFGCARVAGWSAHIVEQRRTGRLIRPSARYVGAAAHSPAEA